MAIGVAALCLGPVPTREELYLVIGRAVDAYPELVPSEPADFRPNQHLFEVRADDGSGAEGLDAALDELTNQPLPGVLWGMWLVHGYASGEFAVVLRGHHARFDGMLLAQFYGLLLGAERAETPRSAPSAGRPERPKAGAAVREALCALRELWHPARPMAADSVLSGRVRHVCTSAELPRMRRIGAAYGATVNDIYLAALAGALAAWESSPQWHGDRRPVRVLIPISLRGPGTSGRLGNEINAGWLALPCGTADPVERLRLVIAGNQQIRARGADPGTGALVRTLPPRMHRLLLEVDNHPRRTSLAATHVPGPSQELSLAGRRITGIRSLSFLAASQRLTACLATYADAAYFSVMADEGVPGLDHLPALWLKELNLLADGTSHR
jgi:hypothetical protein